MKINQLVMPHTLEEALTLLKGDPNNRIIGGGVWMRLGTQEYDTIVALDELKLSYIVQHQSFVEIGAMTTLRDIEQSDVIRGLYDGILSKAVSVIMGMQIRHIATIGGSVAGAYSFSDILPVLIAMDATVHLYPSEEMTVETYIATKHKAPHIITAIHIPIIKGTGYFKKVSKTLLDFSIVNLAITKSERVQIVVGARPGVACRANKASAFLSNNTVWTTDIINEAVTVAMDEISLSSNNRAHADYRSDLLQTYLTRGLKEVM